MNPDPDLIRNVVECALLAAGEPVSMERLLMLFDSDDETVDESAVREALQQLEADYANRGLQLQEVASGWRIQVREEFSSWISRLRQVRPRRYSRALLETLAVMAYQQPVTRGDVEQIRGVAVSSQIIKTLLERDWIRVVGHRDVPGKPALYGTTPGFLDYFGLRSLDELPPLSELRDLAELEPELGFDDPVGDLAGGAEGKVDLAAALEDTEARVEVVPLREVLGQCEPDEKPVATADAATPPVSTLEDKSDDASVVDTTETSADHLPAGDSAA